MGPLKTVQSCGGEARLWLSAGSRQEPVLGLSEHFAYYLQWWESICSDQGHRKPPVRPATRASEDLHKEPIVAHFWPGPVSAVVLQWSQLSLTAEEKVSKTYWLQHRNQGKKATSLEMCACVGWRFFLFMTNKETVHVVPSPKLIKAHKGALCPISQLQMMFLFWQGFYSECNPGLHPAPGLQMQCRYQWDLWFWACILWFMPRAASIWQNSHFLSSLLI